MPPEFREFPDVQLFHNVVRMCEAYPPIIPGSIRYRTKIKLHGVNAGVTIKGGDFIAQSRSIVITEENDCAGFARWAHFHADHWKILPDMTIFGEWCGQGVVKKNKGTAISALPRKIFAVFAIVLPTIDDALLIHDPAAIKAMLVPEKAEGCPLGLHILPYHDVEFTVDFAKKDMLPPVAELLNSYMQTLEPSDPWVKQVFNLDGCAEGMVCYPCINSVDSIKLFENFAFKVKGEKHAVLATKQPVQIAPEVVASTDEFVRLFVTPARCEQGLTATGAKEMRDIPAFLHWMQDDVQKESKDELEAAKLTWDQVKKAVQAAAKTWFIANRPDCTQPAT